MAIKSVGDLLVILIVENGNGMNVCKKVTSICLLMRLYLPLNRSSQLLYIVLLFYVIYRSSYQDNSKLRRDKFTRIMISVFMGFVVHASGATQTWQVYYIELTLIYCS